MCRYARQGLLVGEFSILKKRDWSVFSLRISIRSVLRFAVFVFENHLFVLKFSKLVSLTNGGVRPAIFAMVPLGVAGSKSDHAWRTELR